MSFEDQLRPKVASTESPRVAHREVKAFQKAHDPMHGHHRQVVPPPQTQQKTVTLAEEPLTGNRRAHPMNEHTHPPAAAYAMSSLGRSSTSHTHRSDRTSATRMTTMTSMTHHTHGVSIPLPAESHEKGMHVDPTHSHHRAKPDYQRSALERPGIHSDPTHGHHVTRFPQRVAPQVHPDVATGLILPSHDHSDDPKSHLGRKSVHHTAAKGMVHFGEAQDPNKGLHVDPLTQAHRKGVAGVSGAVRQVSEHPHESAVQSEQLGHNTHTSVDLATETRTQGLHKDVMHNNHRVYREQNWRSHFKLG